jgi:RNA polymerase sigma-70 factor (ECF subfamily)
MPVLVSPHEQMLITRLRESDKTAFTFIFNQYYKDLVRFAYTYTRQPDTAEELVQDVFLKIWENRSKLFIETSLKSFLVRSVQNRSIDWLRQQKVRSSYANMIIELPLLTGNETENYVLHSDLETAFRKALAKLPQQYAEAFSLNRFEALSYSDIAARMGVSVRTIEVRVGKALFLLHNELKDYFLLAFLLSGSQLFLF